MCGIFGYIGTQAKDIPVDEIKKLLHHRGPDDQGDVHINDAVFVHTRLSIIDLSEKGHQPMSNPAGSVWVVFNGEIYNYLELKQQIPEYHFQTSSDTEVLLAAYEKWGENFITKLRGMFSFALYDAREKKLVCAVDRFGIKPFYYYMDAQRFIFSSEVKPLRAAGVSLEPEDSVIYDYMVYGLLNHNNKTFFKNVRQLRPSEQMVYKNGRLKISRYWDLASQCHEKVKTPIDYEKIVDDALKESVLIHLRSDVEYGLSLSSGLDSNILRCMISEVGGLNKPLQCFSYCYVGTEYDECTCFKEDVDHIGIQYNKSNITSENLLSDLPQVIETQEGPIGGAAIYAYWLNMKLASDRGIKVVLNGQGADEIFCGYKYYYEAWLIELYEKKELGLLRDQLRLFNMQHGTDYKLNDNSFHELILSHEDEMSVKAPDGTSLNRHDYLTKEFLKHYRQEAPRFSAAFDSKTKNGMFIDLYYKKIPKLLQFQDRCSMAWGVEARVPFLDHVLAETVFPFPVGVLIDNGKTKSLLRKIARKYEDSLNCLYAKRLKKYMPTPQREWLKYENVQGIKELIGSSVLHERRYIDKHLLMKRYEEYIKQESLGNSFFIWKFMNLEMLFRLFFSK